MCHPIMTPNLHMRSPLPAWPIAHESISAVIPSTRIRLGISSASPIVETSRASRTRSNEHVPLHVHPTVWVGPTSTPPRGLFGLQTVFERSSNGLRGPSGPRSIFLRSFVGLSRSFEGRSSARDGIARPSCARRTCRRRVCTSMAAHYTGVRAQGTRFRADITVNGVKKHLGTFDTAEGAARAYDRCANSSA